MIWFVILLLAYALFELLMAEDGPRVSIGVARLALVLDALLALRSHDTLILGGAVFLTAIILVGAMMVLRKEVQLDHESE